MTPDSLSLVPPGSRRVDGTKATVYITPDGVIRIQAGEVNRPNIPIVLQPTAVERRGGFTIEHLPYAKPAKEFPQEERYKGRQYIMENLPEGYFDFDLNNGNYGRLDAGGWVVIDPDAIRKGRAL